MKNLNATNRTAYSNGVNSPLEYLNITTPAEFKVVMDLLCYYDTFVNKRAVFTKALELVKKYYRPDDTSPETHKSDSEILSEIKSLESKIDNLIDMRAEGVLSKEAFAKKHSKIQAEIDEKKILLNVSAEEVPKDNSECFKESIRNIEQTLHAMSDFKGGASAAFMDKLISSVQVVNSNSYIFNIRYSENYTGAMMCTAKCVFT